MPTSPSAPHLPMPHGLFVLLLSCLSAMAPFSIDMYLPALPRIASDFDVSSQRIQLTLSVFLFGFATGQLVYGILSDRWGRRPLLLGGIFLYLVGTIGCALSTNADMLLLCRFFQALGGSVSVLAVVMVRDIYTDSIRISEVMSQILMVMAVAPLVAPLVGGYFLVYLGWRSIFWFLVIFSALLLVVFYRYLGETHQYKPRQEPILAPFGRVLKTPLTWAYVFAGGSVIAGMFAYITASPFVYIKYFGVSEELYGWLFGINVMGIMLGSYINKRWVSRHGIRRMITLSVWISFIAGGALIVSWLLLPNQLLAVVIPLFLFLLPMGMASANASARLFELFPNDSGAVGSLFGALRFLMGALAGLLVSVLERGDPLAMVSVIGGAGLMGVSGWLWSIRLEQQRELAV